ncbi:hypothetical protein [Clostridium cavendishii]|nr:hypothetical protein [Clostridium cavendishii]
MGIGFCGKSHTHDPGSIGCFLRTETGNESFGIHPGKYMLTCEHVFTHSNPNEEVYQPHPNVKESLCGIYTKGFNQSGQRSTDCGIVHLVFDRRYENSVLKGHNEPTKVNISSIGTPKVGDIVYKYGCSTEFTTGVIDSITASTDGFTNLIEVHGVGNPDGKPWMFGGDSGSVLILKDTNQIIGLNFRIQKGYLSNIGYALPIQSQLDAFNCNFTLI